MKTCLLIDATNVFIRCYSAIPALNKEGIPFGGVIGFLTSLRLYITRTNPDVVILAWDGKGGSKKRRHIIKDYKMGRKPLKLNRNFDFELNNELDNRKFQRSRLACYLKNLPVIQLILEDVEADDVIAYLHKKYNDYRKVIVSTDKDYYQLLDEKTIIFSPTKKIFITAKECYDLYRICPINFIIAKSIVGDRSDNIKGIRGVGFKNIIKYFPFISEKKEIELNQIFSFCEQNGEKYNKFLENKELIIRNFQVMQLKMPIVSFHSTEKINEIISEKTKYGICSFRTLLLEDGITTLTDSYFHCFKILSLKET